MNRLTPIAAALLTVFASPVFAQTAAPAPSTKTSAQASTSPATLEDVTVSGNREDFASSKVSVTKLPADLHDVPQNVVVVTKALLESRGQTSLQDALRNVSGITLGGAEGGQIGNNINLNGFSARTDIYLDGFRDRGQYFRDTFALDQVEVLMGPSSMLFGRGSTGGVINQVTKKAGLVQSSEVSGSVTTNGLYRATADYNQPLSDTSAIRFSAMAQKGGASTRDQTDVEDYGLFTTFSAGLGTPTEITLQALIQHNNDQPDYGLPPLNGSPIQVDRNTAYGLNSDRTKSDVIALNGTIKHKISEDVVFRNMIQFNYVHTDARETAPQAVGTVAAGIFTPVTAITSQLPLSQLFVRGQTHDRVLTDYSISNQTELAAKVDFGGFRHETLLGLELGHEGYNNQMSNRFGDCNLVTGPVANQSFVGCTPVINPGYSAFSSNLASTPYNLQGGSANTVAVYVGDTMALTDHFKLVGGLRQDRYVASVSNTISNATNAPSGASQTINFTSVRAGGIWQPTSAQAYYVSYGTSFNPALEQLTGTVGATNLDPEKNKSYELGGKWDVSENLATNASIFQIQKENARSQITTGVYTLDGTVRVRGAAAGMTGRINKRWQITGNYTYLMAQVIQSSPLDNTLGKVPVNVPKHAFTAWSTYRLAKDWEVGAGPTYQSMRYVTAADTVKVGGYVRWDTSLAYTQPKYDIRLNVFNLTNKMYYDNLIQSDGGRSVPGSGITGMLSINYRM